MISAVILTRNEEKTIERCLKSLTFCNEIVVIDDDSTDKTVEIATRHGASIYKHPLENDFAAQRNFAMSQAKNEWLLFIDGDEIVPNDLQKEILDILEHPSETEAYFLKRKDHFWGRDITHGEVESAYIKGFVRLLKKGSGSWKGIVHEEFVPNTQPQTLEYSILHYPHQTISQFLEDINLYSTLRAQELQKDGKSANMYQIMFMPMGKFLYTYFVKGGYQDGPAGFVYSFMMSFHSFLVRTKVYQYQNNNTTPVR